MEPRERCEICWKLEASHSVTTFSGFSLLVCEECYRLMQRLDSGAPVGAGKAGKGFFAKLKNLFQDSM